MPKRKKSTVNFKDTVDLGDEKIFCPPHHLPHVLPLIHDPITDESCHAHKAALHRLHHNFFCKFLKCPNYEFMMKKTAEMIGNNLKNNMKTILIVGLGNPGKEYEKTRHNAGFLLADYFFEKFREEFGFSDWEEKKKLKAFASNGKKDDMKIILLKPQTFMNLSGEAVSAAVQFYKISPKDIIAVHDEIDLPLGKYRFSTDSSAAGHKGAQNIIDSLGTQNFTRLRIGVDNRDDQPIETEKYVLGKFTDEELTTLEDIFGEASMKLLKYIS